MKSEKKRGGKLDRLSVRVHYLLSTTTKDDSFRESSRAKNREEGTREKKEKGDHKNTESY